jgi:hypothetical protein
MISDRDFETEVEHGFAPDRRRKLVMCDPHFGPLHGITVLTKRGIPISGEGVPRHQREF